MSVGSQGDGGGRETTAGGGLVVSSGQPRPAAHRRASARAVTASVRTTAQGCGVVVWSAGTRQRHWRQGHRRQAGALESSRKWRSRASDDRHVVRRKGDKGPSAARVDRASGPGVPAMPGADRDQGAKRVQDLAASHPLMPFHLSGRFHHHRLNGWDRFCGATSADADTGTRIHPRFSGVYTWVGPVDMACCCAGSDVAGV